MLFSVQTLIFIVISLFLNIVSNYLVEFGFSYVSSLASLNKSHNVSLFPLKSSLMSRYLVIILVFFSFSNAKNSRCLCPSFHATLAAVNN